MRREHLPAHGASAGKSMLPLFNTPPGKIIFVTLQNKALAGTARLQSN
jgi:hypothetical protein